MKTTIMFLLWINYGHSAVALEFKTLDLCESAGYTIEQEINGSSYRCVRIVK